MPTLAANDGRTAFRLPRALLDQARAKAAAEQSSLSDVLRLLLEDYVAGRTAPALLIREMWRLRAELHRIGVNLNQLARAAHTGVCDLGQLAGAVPRLAELVRETIISLQGASRWRA